MPDHGSVNRARKVYGVGARVSGTRVVTEADLSRASEVFRPEDQELCIWIAGGELVVDYELEAESYADAVSACRAEVERLLASDFPGWTITEVVASDDAGYLSSTD